MNLIYKFLIVIAGSLLLGCSAESRLPRATEGEYNYDYAAFDKVFHDVREDATNELHALMVVKDGKVVYEKYMDCHTPDELHIMWSASKTFTALAVGFAVQDGLLKMDDLLVDYLHQDEMPENMDERISKINLHDLITMSSGFAVDPIGHALSGENFDWVYETLNYGMNAEHGEIYKYNSLNTYLLSVVVSRVTGKTVDEYLTEKLFKPLDIREHVWDLSPQGYTAGGWGLHIKLESFAKAGQFMLQRGVWNGKRLLNDEWFDIATKPHIMQLDNPYMSEEDKAKRLKDSPDKCSGYSYQVWVNRNGSYRFDGAWGQFCVVSEEKNALILAFSHTKKASKLLQSFWDNIYDQL